jgi:hypothetical protein
MPHFCRGKLGEPLQRSSLIALPRVLKAVAHRVSMPRATRSSTDTFVTEAPCQGPRAVRKPSWRAPSRSTPRPIPLSPQMRAAHGHSGGNSPAARSRWTTRSSFRDWIWMARKSGSPPRFRSSRFPIPGVSSHGPCFRAATPSKCSRHPTTHSTASATTVAWVHPSVCSRLRRTMRSTFATCRPSNGKARPGSAIPKTRGISTCACSR